MIKGSVYAPLSKFKNIFLILKDTIVNLRAKSGAIKTIFFSYTYCRNFITSDITITSI